VIGFPADEDLDFINNEHTLNYLKKLTKQKPPVKWEERIPNANPMAIDLLVKMLRFSPEKRITVKEAINHPYFASFAHLGLPPESETVFDWSWDHFELNKELL
jgi:serine/threonine protein kinase